MAREPEKTNNDNDRAKPPTKEDLKIEAEKIPEAEKPSQLEPYPTGNPPPVRDYFGRPVNEQGQPLDAEGKVIPEPVAPKEEKK